MKGKMHWVLFVAVFLTLFPIRLCLGQALIDLFPPIEGTADSELLGRSLDCIGPYRGSTVMNVVIGIPGDNSAAGSVEVLSGTDLSVVNVEGSGTPNEKFGTSVSQLTDVDGDGNAELLVGNPGGDNVSVYCSGPSSLDVFISPMLSIGGQGFGTEVEGSQDADTILAVGIPNYNDTACAGANCGAVEFVSLSDCVSTPIALSLFQETLNGALSGASISKVGDLGGTATDDFLVGGPGANGNTGHIRIFTDSGATLANTINGTLAGEEFGMSVSNTADINQDGVDDFVVGAPAANNNTGLIRLFSGASALGTPTVLCTFSGESAGDRFGYVVKGVGDVNNDGAPDFVVGAPGFNGKRGAIYVMNFDVSSGLCTPMFIRTGGQVDEEFGVSLGGLPSAGAACDLNSDGFADFGVGSTLDRAPNLNVGSALFLGGVATPAPTPTPTSTPTPTASPTPVSTPPPATTAQLGFRLLRRGALEGKVVFDQAPGADCTLQILGRITDRSLANRRDPLQLIGPFSPTAREVFFMAGNLPKARGGKQYILHMLANLSCSNSPGFNSNVKSRFVSQCGNRDLSKVSIARWEQLIENRIAVVNASQLKAGKKKKKRKKRGRSASYTVKAE